MSYLQMKHCLGMVFPSRLPNSFSVRQNIFTKTWIKLQICSDKHPFSHFPGWELRLCRLQTPTFKPANSAQSNLLISNKLLKYTLIMNNLYILISLNTSNPSSPHTLPSFKCLLSFVLMPVFSHTKHPFL